MLTGDHQGDVKGSEPGVEMHRVSGRRLKIMHDGDNGTVALASAIHRWIIQDMATDRNRPMIIPTLTHGCAMHRSIGQPLVNLVSVRQYKAK